MAGIQFLAGAGVFLLMQRPDRVWGPSILLSSEYKGLFPRGLNGRGMKLTHSPPTSAEIKNGATIHPLLDMSSWHSAWFIKHGENFPLYFTESL
jgi:hypothetical protein